MSEAPPPSGSDNGLDAPAIAGVEARLVHERALENHMTEEDMPKKTPSATPESRRMAIARQALKGYRDSLGPNERRNPLGALLFIQDYFAKRGVVIGRGGCPARLRTDEPDTSLEEHEALALLTLMLGQELGLPALVPEEPSSMEVVGHG